MYPRSKFLELLLDIRRAMAAEAGYDVEEFVQDLRTRAPSSDVEQPETLLEPDEPVAPAVGRPRKRRRLTSSLR